MTALQLPEWAEDVLRRFGPHPAWRALAADPAAMARYANITERFRLRWHLELAPDVWSMFGIDGESVKHVGPARHLLGLMIDIARYGSRVELAAKRQALVDVARLDDEVRGLSDQLRCKLELRDFLMHEHLIEGGLSDDAADALGRATAETALQSWQEPRLHNSDFQEAISSRKTARDALALMLHQLEGIEPLLRPVILTDRARASIFNVAHDAPDSEHYSAEAVKKARADIRKR